MAAKRMRARTTPEAGQNEIVISDIGPIEHLKIKAEPGTVTVLTGRNGAGKSIALNAADALTGGKSKIESRDGTTGGYVEGWGVKITIARGGANRRRGDVECVALEDRMRISELVDPGVIDPHAADERRIKALVQLSGQRADFDLFKPHLPAGWETYVDPKTIASKDIVEMAARLKREVDRRALAVEREAEGVDAEMVALEKLIDNVDMTQPHDAAVLSKETEAAIVDATRLESNRDTVFQMQQKAEQSQAAIDKAKAEHAGASIKDCEALYDAETKANNTARDHVLTVREQLRDAEAAYNASNAALQAAADRLQAARQFQSTIAAWQTDVDAAAGVKLPQDDDIEEARERVALAKLAESAGTKVRDAIKVKAQRDELGKKRDLLVKQAEQLRIAAGSTNTVLTQIVANMGCVLKVDKEFRLVAKTPQRGDTYFGDLSHGERTRTAIDISVAAFEAADVPGILCLDQELWESLDGANRDSVCEQIKGTRVAILTAEADKVDVADTVGAVTLES